MAYAISVEVFRSGFGDCSNGGVSSKFRSLLVPCEWGTSPLQRGPYEYDPDNPPENLCNIERRELFGQVILTLVPANGKGWHMYGGNKADTSDSRWGELLERVSGNPFYRYNHTLDIHDRYE